METVRHTLGALEQFFLPFHVDKLNASARTDALQPTLLLGPLPLPAGVPDYIQMAIPLMLSMVVIEFVFTQITTRLRRSKSAKLKLKPNDEHPLFRTNDSINSLSLGTTQQVDAANRSVCDSNCCVCRSFLSSPRRCKWCLTRTFGITSA